MNDRSRRLTQSARLLRVRLYDLQTKKPSELQRPMHEVAVRAVREELTKVGRQLTRERS